MSFRHGNPSSSNSPERSATEPQRAMVRAGPSHIPEGFTPPNFTYSGDMSRQQYEQQHYYGGDYGGHPRGESSKGKEKVQETSSESDDPGSSRNYGRPGDFPPSQTHVIGNRAARSVWTKTYIFDPTDHLQNRVPPGQEMSEGNSRVEGDYMVGFNITQHACGRGCIAFWPDGFDEEKSKRRLADYLVQELERNPEFEGYPGAKCTRGLKWYAVIDKAINEIVGQYGEIRSEDERKPSGYKLLSPYAAESAKALIVRLRMPYVGEDMWSNERYKIDIMLSGNSSGTSPSRMGSPAGRIPISSEANMNPVPFIRGSLSSLRADTSSDSSSSSFSQNP